MSLTFLFSNVDIDFMKKSKIETYVPLELQVNILFNGEASISQILGMG